MRPTDRMVAAIVAMLAIRAASALGADDVRALVAGCRSCHENGETVIPSLDGRTRDALVGKLRAFRNGSQSGTVMPQLAKGYTDAQLEAIADYLTHPGRP